MLRWINIVWFVKYHYKSKRNLKWSDHSEHISSSRIRSVDSKKEDIRKWCCMNSFCWQLCMSSSFNQYSWNNDDQCTALTAQEYSYISDSLIRTAYKEEHYSD
jgi:hypothetical protein